MKSQPSFNKNFNLLIEDLKKQTQLGRTNYMFTANARQVERFYSIFEDLGAKVQFIPIAKSIHEGFIDDSAKVVCYTITRSSNASTLIIFEKDLPKTRR
jgi:transcription-repair coupling factor (superfamily II helicase)